MVRACQVTGHVLLFETVGAGEVGSQIAGALRFFGVTTVGLNRTGSPAEGFDETHKFDDRENRIERGDYIILALPLTKETEGIIGREFIDSLKRDALLINIARGDVIDELYLAEALDNGQLRRAVLDVFQQEPLPEDSPLWTNPRVTVTPHIAGVTDPELSVDEFVRNNKRFKNGEPLEHLVDIRRGY